MAHALTVLGGSGEVRIKQTRSRCPVCLVEVVADVVESRGVVLMRKRCPAHGAFEVPLARDRR